MAKGDNVLNNPAGVGMNPSFTGMNRFGGLANMLMSAGNAGRQISGDTSTDQGMGIGPSRPINPYELKNDMGIQNPQLGTADVTRNMNDMGMLGGMNQPVPGSAGTIAPSGSAYNQLFNMFGNMTKRPNRQQFGGS